MVDNRLGLDGTFQPEPVPPIIPQETEAALLSPTSSTERGRFNWLRTGVDLVGGSGVMMLSMYAVMLAEGSLRGMPLDKILSSPMPDWNARINTWLPVSSGLFISLGSVASIVVGIVGMVAIDRLIFPRPRFASRSS